MVNLKYFGSFSGAKTNGKKAVLCFRSVSSCNVCLLRAWMNIEQVIALIGSQQGEVHA